MPKEGTSFIEVLDAATATDLERIELEISSQTKRLEALKAAAKVLRIKVHGKGTSDRGAKQKRAWAIRKARKLLAKHLARGARGSPTQLAQTLGIDPDDMPEVLDCPWFENTQIGINVTAEGKRQVAA